MEQVLSSGSSMITEASGNAREIAEQIGAQPTLEGLIVTGIVGLLICFFGLKLIRLQAALVGFLMGALIGIGVAWTAGISGLTFAIVVFACGAVLAALSFFLYKFGVFCVVFCVCLGMGVQIADPQSTLPLVIVLVIALILAIVAVIFVEPVIIICTGISGGVTAGISAAADLRRRYRRDFRCGCHGSGRDLARVRHRRGSGHPGNGGAVYDAFPEGREEGEGIRRAGERSGFCGI